MREASNAFATWKEGIKSRYPCWKESDGKLRNLEQGEIEEDLKYTMYLPTFEREESVCLPRPKPRPLTLSDLVAAHICDHNFQLN